METQEGSHCLLTLGPVTLTPQVQRAIVPDYCFSQSDGQAGVQVWFVLTQTRLCG